MDVSASSVLIPATAGIIGAVLGAIAGALGTYYIEKLKIKNIDSQKRQQVYSQLLGLKFVLSQIYTSTYQAKMLFDFNMARMKSSHDENCSQEALRQRNEIVNLINETAKMEQYLWETIGLIQVLFPSTATLHEKIAPLELIRDHFKIFEHRDNDQLKECYLDSWKKTTKTEINETIKLRIEEPLSDLLEYLKKEIENEQS